MEPTLAEIRIFAGNFAPRSWALCQGQLLPINSNQALFSLLGTTYGGDGRTSFGLPDMRGRTAVHAGNGPGLSDRRLGAKTGAPSVTLNLTNLANHEHSDQLRCSLQTGTSDLPVNNFPAVGIATRSDGADIPVLTYATTSAVGQVVGNTSNAGNQQPINLHQPYLGLNYIIALQGIFPSRS